MTDLEKLKARVNADDSFIHFLGIEVTDIAEGYCECRAPLGPERNNPNGTAHGGFLISVCDSAAGVAGTALGRHVIGRSIDFHFLRPGKGAYVTARARVVHAGRTAGLCQAELFDEQERLIGTGSFELRFLDADRQGA